MCCMCPSSFQGTEVLNSLRTLSRIKENFPSSDSKDLMAHSFCISLSHHEIARNPFRHPKCADSRHCALQPRLRGRPNPCILWTDPGARGCRSDFLATVRGSHLHRTWRPYAYDRRNALHGQYRARRDGRDALQIKGSGCSSVIGNDQCSGILKRAMILIDLREGDDTERICPYQTV